MAGNLTHTLTFGRDAGAGIRSKRVTVTGGSAIELDETVPAGSNTPVAVAFDKDKLQYLFIVSDKDATLEFNDATSPVPAIPLVANEPWVWERRLIALLPNPFSANVVSAFLTNTEDARLQMDGLVDPT